uniref:Uncharacterized protein n=1 Tax=Tanacetum cinerariifolium TaxID=118510 RepID=A0A6L2MC61_TANCI|nr:hypothetical protein [Tanacetum cinerariifolium]
MDMKIHQQVALDEYLVPHASRLKIRKINFRLRSDITSKESTLQLVYDVLRLTLFYKAFLVTVDVPEIYMQGFWATAMIHHHSIRFKRNNKKRIINLEYLREMLHICPRLPNQTFNELPFEEEILAFLRYLGYTVINKCLSRKSTGYYGLWLSQAQILCGMYHKKNVDFAYLLWEDLVYQVEHKDAKKSNEMYYSRFTKVIIHFFMTKDLSIPRKNKVNWHYVRDDQMFTTIKLVSRHQNTQKFDAILHIKLTNEDIKNFAAYKEYYAVALGAAPPKTKASVGKTQSNSDTTITPLTAAGTRLSTSVKGKQPAKSSKAKGLSVLPKVAMTKAEQIKIAMKRSLQQTHISQASGSSADEGTGSLPGVPDVPTVESNEEISWKSSDKEDDDEVDDRNTNNDGDDFIHPKLSIHEEEKAKDEESFDPIVQTPENSNDDASLSMNVGDKEGHDAEDDDEELYRDVNINLEDIKEQVKEQVKVQVSKILPKIEKTVNEKLEAKVLTRSSNSSKTSYAVAADLSEMELKKILIEKIENNKSIHRSAVQRNLYKALVDAYECDKIFLDTYGDTVTLKRRRDDADKDEEPSVGSDRGSKRRREGKEPESTSVTKEKATKTTTTQDLKEPSHQEFETGATDDQPITEASQHPEWFQKQKKPPTPDRAWNKTLPATHGSIQPWISDLAKQADSRSSFNELIDTHVDFLVFLMNRLKVDTLTPELLVGPTYELIKGSCKSLVELEFFLEEVYKVTTDQLDWNNPEGQQYPHNLLKPLPLIPNSRGRRVIPFDHFINNDLEYLRGGASSCKYTTSVTKKKTTDYGHIKWIKDLFYGFTVNKESAQDVYSKRRIIAVTELQIVEWHNYKNLDWITVCRDDDKLYKFKEGDFKRLRIQDIEDMLLLLVLGKLTNLTVEEHFAFKVSLRMFMRSIVIQRHVENLQLGIESYQKKLNLTKPDTYHFDLKRKEAYTAYLHPRGFIY